MKDDVDDGRRMQITLRCGVDDDGNPIYRTFSGVTLKELWAMRDSLKESVGPVGGRPRIAVAVDKCIAEMEKPASSEGATGVPKQPAKTVLTEPMPVNTHGTRRGVKPP